MNAEAIARNHYRQTDEFKKNSIATTLFAVQANYFLQNRLEAAFLAGVQAGKQIAREEGSFKLALEKIRDLDYRGNQHESHFIAKKALE
jgi:hypothetical protein